MTDTDTDLVYAVAPPVLLDTPVPPALAAAVVAAFAELSNLTKDKKAVVDHKSGGGSHSYTYNDLADVVEMARPILARHGLAMLQPVSRRMGQPLVIETWLLHESGNMLRWSFEASAEGGPQGIGSAITYARRYCGQAALGVASEDDDGKAAQTATPPARPAPTRKAPPRRSPDPVTAKAMILFGELGYGDKPDRLRLTSEILDRAVESWTDVTPREQAVVLDELERRSRADRDAYDETDGRTAQHDIDEDADHGPY